MTSTRSSSDTVITYQPCVILFYSIGNCFDQIEPSRSATECSGVRFHYIQSIGLASFALNVMHQDFHNSFGFYFNKIGLVDCTCFVKLRHFYQVHIVTQINSNLVHLLYHLYCMVIINRTLINKILFKEGT